MSLSADVVVIGGGLIGSATALALADGFADVILMRQPYAGAASAAAAGMLAPSLDAATGGAHEFSVVARDLFPDYVASLQERSGHTIALNRSGICEIALDPTSAANLRARAGRDAIWWTEEELRRVEPSLAVGCGAVLWPDDGAVDNVAMLAALETVIAIHPRIRILDTAARSISADAHTVTVGAESGLTATGSEAVLAAGAWSGLIQGAGVARVIEPVRGQLVAFERSALTHIVYAADVYCVPRPGCTVAGSTMERVGFNPSTSDEGISAITREASALCPALAGAGTHAWAGLRPVTPDLLPILGRDPERPPVIFACGHSRNGVLLTPITAHVVRELVFEDSLTFDLHQFRPERFAGTFTQA